MDKASEQIILKMPKEYAAIFKNISTENLQEIRFRTGRNICLYYVDGIKELDAILKGVDIERIVSAFCSNSVYAYCNSIRDGFITLGGGHRVGIVGRAVYKEERLSNIVDFSGINIRIAREHKGCSDGVIDEIYKEGKILNTLIISAPNAGKTTLLRDIARHIGERCKVVIVDERSEIAAQSRGTPQFDVGKHTDVLDGFTKTDGIMRALRSLSPDVIITDEIGTNEDMTAIRSILKGGAKIITSLHAESFEDAMQKKERLISMFDLAIVLQNREVIQCLKL